MTGRFVFSTNVHPAETFAVASFDGVEETSKPFSFEIWLRASSTELESELVGKRAFLRIAGADTHRDIAGVVAFAELTETLVTGAVYRVELRPRLFTLGLNQNSRVFQDMTVPQIVDDVLERHGIERTWAVARTYPERVYCVQYEESDLAFVERLVAEEGIFYCVSTTAADGGATEKIVFMDDAAYEPIAEPATLPFHAPDGLEQSRDAIESLSWGRHMATAESTVTGFDFRRPTARLKATAKAPENGSGANGEAYEHDLDWGGFTVRSETAQVRLEQRRHRETAGVGESRCPRLQPGRSFELADHPRADLNRRFVPVRIEHRGRAPEETSIGRQDGDPSEVYKNRFTLLPDDVAARPRRPARQHRQIVETATVVGPAGEEIHTDEHGRVKVQFHWDREGAGDDHSSCWVRPMVPWAGAAWGTQFIPRVGMEVVVTFAGGNADRPIILGSLYNGANVPPFVLPAKKTQSGIRTRSTPGGEGSNELRFDDAAGAEQIYVHAQRDLVEVVENDRARNVHGHEHVRIDKSQNVEVLQDHVRHVLGNEVVTVEQNLVLNVVGAQIIHIDGQSDALRKSEPEGVVVDQGGPGAAQALESDAASTESALQAAVRYASRRRGAELTWVTELLPEPHYERGMELSSQVRDIGDEVAALYLAARDFGARTALAELAEEALPLEEQIAAIVEQAAPIEQQLAAAKARIASALAEVLEPAAEPLHRLQKSLVTFLTDMDRAGDEAMAMLESAKAGEPPVAAGEILGRMKGGGGAFAPSAAKAEIKPNYTDKGDTKLDKGSSLLSVTGDGAIIATGKLLLTAAHVIVNGPEVTIEGGTIKVNGGTVNVDGGTVNVKGDINLN